MPAMPQRGRASSIAPGAGRDWRTCLCSTLIGTLFLTLHTPTVAATRTQVADLADLSLEQLGNVVVTSVSRRQQPLGSAATSIYVINADDIRRSGATTCPRR
jgi:iron complex outermembrane recepter protein